MKKLLIPLLFLFIMCASGNGNDGKLSLIGKWDVVDFEANMPQVDRVTIGGGEMIALATDYTFTQDGKMITHLKSEGVDITGSWEYDSTTKTLTTTDKFGPEGQTVEAKHAVISSSESKMEWHQKLGGGLGSTITYLEKY